MYSCIICVWVLFCLAYGDVTPHLSTTAHIVRISTLPKMLARSLFRRQVAGLSKNAGFSTSIARSAGNLSVAQDQVR